MPIIWVSIRLARHGWPSPNFKTLKAVLGPAPGTRRYRSVVSKKIANALTGQVTQFFRLARRVGLITELLRLLRPFHRKCACWIADSRQAQIAGH